MPSVAGRLLVDIDPTAEQSTKRAFLDRLRQAVHEAAARELAGTDWTVEHCPWFAYWFAYYEGRSARDIEAALHKYAPETLGARTAGELVDPLVARVRRAIAHWRATGEIDSPPAAIPDAIVTQAELGPGRPLDSTTRTRMENAMDTSLAGIRLHDDAVAADVVASAQGRALAVGSHVAFANAEYRPGTVVGDALLAHELAHTVQQRTATAPSAGGALDRSLERAADRHAMGIFARLRLGIASLLPVPQVQASGLRLQRCSVKVDEKQLPAVAADPPIAESVQPVSSLDLSTLPFVDLSKPRPVSSDAVLLISGTRAGSTQTELFLVPAAGFVFEGPERKAVAVQRPLPPQQQPSPPTAPPTQVLSMPAASHAGVHLINTGSGTGMLLDVAGTANDKGTPSVLVSQGLLRLQTEMGIQRVDKAFISHAHADHAGALSWMVQHGNLTGSTIWLLPGMEQFTTGPLGRELAKLGTGTVSPLFPRGWTATPLDAQPLPQVPTVTVATLPVGNATLRMAVGTAELSSFVQTARRSGWSPASPLADAATPLTHVSWQGTHVEAVVVGDLRGITISNLATRMGDARFDAFVGNARVVIGLHHLGAIKSPADVRGLQRLLKAMGGGAQPITVLAQVGPEFPVNERLVAALQVAGARVITVDRPDPSRPDAHIKVDSTGSVEQQGGRVAEIDPVTKGAQKRIETLERARRTIERLHDYRGIEGATRFEILEGLKLEIKRLTELLSSRQVLSTRDLHVARPTPASLQELATNAAAIGRVEGMEKHAEKALPRLALSPQELETLVKEQKLAEAAGTTSQALRQLLARVDPMLAQQILMEEKSAKPKTRDAQARMWKRIHHRLATQEKLEATREPGKFGASAKAPALVGLALQAYELVAAPAIENWAKSRDAAEHEDFYMFFRDLLWWNEKGIRVPARWSPSLSTVEQVKHGIARRLHDDTPKAQREQVSDEVANATPLTKLWVPPLDHWDTTTERAAFFETLRLWLDLHVRTVDDYYAELRTGITAPIRPADKHDLFGDWQLHVGVVDGEHVHGAWQTSEALTAIMKATMTRATAGTQAQIDNQIAALDAVRDTPTAMGTASRSASVSHGRAVRRVSVGVKAAMLYTYVNGQPKKLDVEARRDGGWRFLQLNGPAPSGYTWVAPADAETALSLGSLVGMQFRREVRIPKPQTVFDVSDPDFRGRRGDRPIERYMNEEQIAAWRAYEAGAEGYFFDDKEVAGYRGTVSIHETGLMEGGVVLVRISDLVTDR